MTRTYTYVAKGHEGLVEIVYAAEFTAKEGLSKARLTALAMASLRQVFPGVKKTTFVIKLKRKDH